MDKLCLKAMVVAMFLGLAFTAPVKAQPTTWHVDDDAAPGGNGRGWDVPDAPFQFLQDALDSAAEGDLIKVAQGIYHPDDDSLPSGMNRTLGDRAQSFVLIGGPLGLGFTMEGGYVGIIDLPNADVRDPALFDFTILSGDLDDDDMGGFGDMTRDENSLSVVNGGIGTDDGTVLDGFTIRDGDGGAGGISGVGGAGMFVPTLSSPTIRNCIFTLNQTAGSGGGMLLDDRSMSLIEDCLFILNQTGEGGGMTIRNFSDPDIRRCRFEHNTATNRGGGGVLMKLQGRGTFTD